MQNHKLLNKDKNSIKLGLHGYGGRMTNIIYNEINHHPEKYDFYVNATFSKQDYLKCQNKDNILLAKFCQENQLIIDFSHSSAIDDLLYNIELSTIENILLIGTTGITESQYNKLTKLAQNNVILHSNNTSIAPFILSKVAQIIDKMLANEKPDVEIIEKHHKFKKDCPSGTAIMIGESIAKNRGKKLDEMKIFRQFGAGEDHVREYDNIGFSSIRAGGIFGDHSVIFGMEDSVIELSSSSLNRGVFAKGALKIAKWLICQKPGKLLTMDDYI